MLRHQIKGFGGELALLVPRLAQKVPGLRPPVGGEPETARYVLFEAMSSFVAVLAQSQPLVLALDDLHWADKPTVLLLRHLLRSAAGGVCLLATYRDTDLTPTHALADVLADLRRDHLVERMALVGLARSEIAEFAEAVTGREVPAELAGALHRRTEGNPFFLGEVLRYLVETGTIESATELVGIPEGVREVVGRRVMHLSGDANILLTWASVMGREFDLAAIEQAGELSSDQVLGAIEEAVAARLVEEVADAPEHYAFSHMLVRDTLYHQLVTARRVRMHRQIGEALEALYGDDPQHLAELALHFYEAASGALDKAVEYSRQAGEHASSLLAYEEAAGHFERALQALDLATSDDPPRRIELLLCAADARWRAGDLNHARIVFLDAAERARHCGRADLLARAALGVGRDFYLAPVGVPSNVGLVDEILVALLEEALAAFGPDDSVIRAQLLGRLAVALYYTPSVERRRELIAEEIAIARRLGDRALLVDVLLDRRQALWGPDDLEERLEADAEIVRLAEAAGDARQVVDAIHLQAMDLLEKGDLAGSDERLETHRRLAEDLRQPMPIYLNTAMRAVKAAIHGDFAGAETLAAEAMAIGEPIDPTNALGVYGGLMLWSWRELGRMDELESAMEAILAHAAALPAAQAGAALALTDLGRMEEARKLFDDLGDEETVPPPRDLTWLAGMAVRTLACVALVEVHRAAILYRLLEPFAGRLTLAAYGACWGPVSYHLGLLAVTMGRPELAGKHFERTVSSGLRPFVAHAQCQLEELHLASDPDRARQLIDQSLATADELGMKPLAAQARRALTRIEENSSGS